MWKRKAEKQRKREEERREQENLEMEQGLGKLEQLEAYNELEKQKKGGRPGWKKKQPESEMARKNVKDDKKQKNKRGEKENESSSSSDEEFVPPDMSSPRMRERRNAVIESTCRVPFERARSADRSRKQSPSGSPFGRVTRVLSPKSTGPPIHVDDSRKFRRDVLDDIAKFKRALYMQPTKLPQDEIAETSKVERRECQSLGGNSPQRRREQSAAAATRRTRSATSSPRINVGTRPKTSSTSIPGTSKIPRSIRDVKRLLNSLSVSSCEIHTKTDETSSTSSEEDTPKKSKKGFKWFRRIRERASSKPRGRSRSLEDGVFSEFRNVFSDPSRAVASMMTTKPSKWFSKRHKPKSKKQKAKEFIEDVFNIKIDELKIVKLMKETFGSSSSEETTSTEIDEDEPSTSKKGASKKNGSSSKKGFGIFKRDSSSPSKKDASPSKKDASPSKKDASPSKKDASSSKKDYSQKYGKSGRK